METHERGGRKGWLPETWNGSSEGKAAYREGGASPGGLGHRRLSLRAGEGSAPGVLHGLPLWWVHKAWGGVGGQWSEMETLLLTLQGL